MSQPGIDVTTATNSQLVFNSAQNTFKTAKTGTATLPAVTQAANTLSVGSVAVPHGLGYVPIAQVYGQFNVSIDFSTSVQAYLLLPYNLDVYGSTLVGVNQLIVYASVDATNLYITYSYGTGSGSGYTFPKVKVKYYLLQEASV